MPPSSCHSCHCPWQDLLVNCNVLLWWIFVKPK
jgi:hypothetical protein